MMLPYSVLLLYPDYIADTFGHETFYTHVTVKDPKHAVKVAQRDAAAFNELEKEDACDFFPLLVLDGHHMGLEIDF